jgi:hypothetical protein
MENQRLNKALSEKMCLLSATYKNDSNEWDFKMRGNTNNFYQEKTFLMKPEDFFVINA